MPTRTPLPESDLARIAAFWNTVEELGLVEPGDAMPTADVFGDSVELADELIDLVIHGPKRATASSYEGLVQNDELVPEVGGLWIALDGRGLPRALLRTTDVRVGPLSSVDDAFAWDEGEGDRTRADWLRAHTTFFRRSLREVGIEFRHDMPTVFERFEVVYSE